MAVQQAGHRWAVWVLASVTGTLAACGGGGSPTAPAAPAATPAPAPSPTPVSGPTVLRSATFQSANGYTTEGGATIVRDGSAHRLELRQDFRTSQSGALDVRLCRETRCTSTDLNLGSVQGFSGAQQYALPDDGSAYRYAVIWCRAVNLPFGFGELK
jgi:hypothetical protein